MVNLQAFFEKDLNIKGKWTSASGAKLLKLDDLQIRWYSQEETLTLNGPKAEEYKSLLEAKATILNITGTTESVDDELHQSFPATNFRKRGVKYPSLYKTIDACIEIAIQQTLS